MHFFILHTQQLLHYFHSNLISNRMLHSFIILALIHVNNCFLSNLLNVSMLVDILIKLNNFIEILMMR